MVEDRPGIEQPLIERFKEKLQLSKVAAESFSDELNIASFEKDDEENGHDHR